MNTSEMIFNTYCEWKNVQYFKLENFLNIQRIFLETMFLKSMGSRTQTISIRSSQNFIQSFLDIFYKGIHTIIQIGQDIFLYKQIKIDFCMKNTLFL